jgi:hypothetical protein
LEVLNGANGGVVVGHEEGEEGVDRGEDVRLLLDVALQAVRVS